MSRSTARLVIECLLIGPITEVVLALLLSNFKFSATDKEVYWNSAGVTYPTVGPNASKAAMPLTVERIHN